MIPLTGRDREASLEDIRGERRRGIDPQMTPIFADDQSRKQKSSGFSLMLTYLVFICENRRHLRINSSSLHLPQATFLL